MADFAQTIATAYAGDGAALDLGRGVLGGAVVPAATVKLPLRMANRHGLIAGATGTGKTKTLQGPRRRARWPSHPGNDTPTITIYGWSTRLRRDECP